MNENNSSTGLWRTEPNVKLGKPGRYEEIKRRTPSGQQRGGPAPDAQRESTELPETDRKVGQTIAYMLQHLNQHIEVAKLAALVNVSPSHFFALFKRRTGCAPIDFFIRLRMQHACQLLDGTSLNVKEVAGVLGYDDPFYFSRTFKAVNHVAPTDYRSMPRERKDAVRNAALPPALVGASQANSALALGLSAPPQEFSPAAGDTGLPPARESDGRRDRHSNGRILHGRPAFACSTQDSYCHTKSDGAEISRS